MIRTGRFVVPRARRRIRAEGGRVAVAVAVLALAFGLMKLQVLDMRDYATMARENRLRSVVIPAPRGTIYDRHGEIAASGTVNEGALAKLMRLSYFSQKPPKTAGREEFGGAFVEKFLRSCGRSSKPDLVATATALTAISIADAVERYVQRGRGIYSEMIVSGGGAKNPTLMGMLANALWPQGVTLRLSDEFGVPSEAKEAIAFAVLANETWHRRASNVPSATGARQAAVLGKISYA